MADKIPVPKHIGIIMDGNGRWAQNRGEPRINGHRQGMLALKEIVETTRRLGVDVLTVYAFSTENWKRPKTEVGFLMKLLQLYIRSELKSLRENGIALRFIGSRDKIDSKVLSMMEMIEEKTAGGQDMLFQIAFNYGGRQEMVEAIRRIATEAAEGRLAPEAIDEAVISANLYTAGVPDPDLIIRTSGEYRTSNFLLWQSAYSEYYITDILWPDFREPQLMEAISAFNQRNRRFGGIENEQ